MQPQNAEVYIVILAGVALAILLVSFIIISLFLFQRRRQKQEREIARMKDLFDKELLQSQLEIQEATLKNIAQELHDNIGQMLSVVKHTLATIPKNNSDAGVIQESSTILHKAISDLSNVTKSMHTDRIRHIGLVEAIKFELDMLSRTKLFETSYSIAEDQLHFEEDKEIFLFRIFQEIINNIIKHAKATKVDVKLGCSQPDRFLFTISDNGRGFDVNEKKESVSSSAGVGLKSLYNRAKLIGATVNINSEIGKGTSVSIDLPLEPN